MSPMEQQRLARSPFAIPREDVGALLRDEGFGLLRRCLAGANSFCDFHSAASGASSTTDHDEDDYDDSRATWLLHRDLLHALTMPVVQLFGRAASLAQAALCAQRGDGADLELAFSGEARSAFVWLQCFLGEEEAWAQTRGCPGCIITATLSTESHLRFTIAASLLSTSAVASPPCSPPASVSSSPTASPTTERPAPPSTPSLPPLPHILPALREALAADPFWGPDYWPYLLAKASQLSGGIQALIASCADLEALVESPRKIHARGVGVKREDIAANGGSIQAEEAEKGAKLSKSKLAKRQLRLQNEEAELLRRCALQCWAKAAVPSRVRGEVLGVARAGRERRGTCP